VACISPAGLFRPSQDVREVASGVDALYLSGRAVLSDALLADLEAVRAKAEESGQPAPFRVAGEEFEVEPRAFGKYRFRLVHSSGLVGITPSEHLPALRVQPRAEFLHGVGPGGVVEFFSGIGEFLAGGPVCWSLSRLDLFCDVQGWVLHGDDRHRFVCRAERRDLHEHGETLGGFEFGRRTSGTVCARIYDKTRQVEEKGLDWWPAVWGERFDRRKPVLRVEAEIGRAGLREFGVNSPTEGIDAAGALWASVTENWLTYRRPTSDETRSRWPVAAEWSALQRASLRCGAIGAERARALRRKGQLRLIVPQLVGYAARVGALLATDDLDTTMAAIRRLVQDDEIRRGTLFADRIAEKAAEEARR
jgi:hypothetical protein